MRKWLGQDYKPWSVPACVLGYSIVSVLGDACVDNSVVVVVVQAEEEAEVEYTEEEEAIKAYLEGGMEEMLPGELLQKIIGEFWDKEPFK